LAKVTEHYKLPDHLLRADGKFNALLFRVLSTSYKNMAAGCIGVCGPRHIKNAMAEVI